MATIKKTVENNGVENADAFLEKEKKKRDETTQ
jgi:hypothetical protein